MLARMERARTAGAVGLILTLDWSFSHGRDWGSPPHPPIPSPQKEILPHAFELPGETGVGLVVGCAKARFPGFVVPNFASVDERAPLFFEAYGTWMTTPPPTWEDVAWLRSEWGRPVHGQGNRQSRRGPPSGRCGHHSRLGSNHGGNNVDSAPAPIRVLQEIAGAGRRRDRSRSRRRNPAGQQTSSRPVPSAPTPC